METDWLETHHNDDGIRVIESNEDILLYDTGHIPGAVHIDWRADLQDPLIRDYISSEKFARLCNRHGITPTKRIGGRVTRFGRSGYLAMRKSKFSTAVGISGKRKAAR